MQWQVSSQADGGRGRSRPCILPGRQVGRSQRVPPSEVTGGRQEQKVAGRVGRQKMWYSPCTQAGERVVLQCSGIVGGEQAGPIVWKHSLLQVCSAAHSSAWCTAGRALLQVVAV